MYEVKKFDFTLLRLFKLVEHHVYMQKIVAFLVRLECLPNVAIATYIPQPAGTTALKLEL